MKDTIDEIKANLPVETTTAYAGIMALTDPEKPASYIGIMLVVFSVLLVFTIILSVIRTKSATAIGLSVSGFIIWVVNIDATRFENIIANIYNEYLLPDGADPSGFTDSLGIILPAIAILYSALIMIISVARAKGMRHAQVS